MNFSTLHRLCICVSHRVIKRDFLARFDVTHSDQGYLARETTSRITGVVHFEKTHRFTGRNPIWGNVELLFDLETMISNRIVDRIVHTAITHNPASLNYDDLAFGD